MLISTVSAPAKQAALMAFHAASANSTASSRLSLFVWRWLANLDEFATTPRRRAGGRAPVLNRWRKVFSWNSEYGWLWQYEK